MNMLDSVLGNESGSVVRQLGQQFGLSDTQASSALDALLPALAAGFQRNASTSSGLEALLGALAGGGHRQYLDDLSTLGRAETVDDGNGILGHIFGSKDVSREVARRASTQSGVGPDVLKRMLPVVAALVMGAMARQQAAGASAPAGTISPARDPSGGGLLDMLTPMLDTNRDGSMVDDVIGMIGKMMR
jgi:hypothetical protein